MIFGSSLGEGSLLWSEGNHHCFIFPPFVPVTSSWAKVSGEVIYSCSEAASRPLTLGVLPLTCELRVPVDCGLPGSSVHASLLVKMLECVAISFSRGSSRPRD